MMDLRNVWCKKTCPTRACRRRGYSPAPNACRWTAAKPVPRNIKRDMQVKMTGKMPRLFLLVVFFVQSCAASQQTLSISVSEGQIAFACERDNKIHICLINVDGSEQVQLTDNFADSYFAPAWSPDGKDIAFNCFFVTAHAIDG